MIYRTCAGCSADGQPCEAREAVKAQMTGLGVTSIKWKCKDRTARISPGDAIWAFTIEGAPDAYDDEGEPYRDHFPGVAIKQIGSKMLVFIAPGSEGRDFGDERKFTPKGNGFCKLPLSRLTIRDAEPQEICRSCDMPASLPHQEGYACNPYKERYAW